MIEARRSRICKAAIERFANDGYRATTMQSIADTAKMSVGQIYDYFHDKEDLLVASMNDVLDAYGREVPVAVSGKSDPFEQFTAAVHAFARVVNERRQAWLIGYREFHVLSSRQRKQILDKDVATTKLIEDRIVACMKAGLFHPVEARMLTYQILLLIQGWALSAWRLPRMTWRDYIDSGLSILLKPVQTDRCARMQTKAE
ncbi:TetR/AcrR family transcriptional regulator [Reyranella sp.]|uniref:TetR/AcrR family transcriptional regulator n=1 Tax=Reyranella sp. TaxID=1929291 RepID=UPI00378420A4